MLDHISYLTPREIVKELDKYIIGQVEAKKNVAIALRNRWRRMNIQKEFQKEITPINILMIGPTGVGKTEIARRLSIVAKAPFIKVEASKFTEVGYVGRDVESMIRDLVEQSINMVKKEKREKIIQQASDQVETKILDILVPKNNTSNNPSIDQAIREEFRTKLRKKELEKKKIEVTIEESGSNKLGIIGSGMNEDIYFKYARIYGKSTS